MKLEIGDIVWWDSSEDRRYTVVKIYESEYDEDLRVDYYCTQNDTTYTKNVYPNLLDANIHIIKKNKKCNKPEWF